MNILKKLPKFKSLTSQISRSIVTYASKDLEKKFGEIKHPDFKGVIEKLQKSTQTYHVTEGVGKYDYMTRNIQVRPQSHHQALESIAHETFHAFQHDEMSKKLDEGSIDSLMRNKSQLSILEAGALYFGKKVSGGKLEDVPVHHNEYVKNGRVDPFSESKQLLTKSYHEPTFKELEELKRNKPNIFKELSGSSAETRNRSNTF